MGSQSTSISYTATERVNVFRPKSFSYFFKPHFAFHFSISIFHVGQHKCELLLYETKKHKFSSSFSICPLKTSAKLTCPIHWLQYVKCISKCSSCFRPSLQALFQSWCFIEREGFKMVGRVSELCKWNVLYYDQIYILPN